MIYSMTAFAQSQRQTAFGTLMLELRSVNHRYLEFNCKLPESLRQLEIPLREATKKQLSRGKVDCVIRFHDQQDYSSKLTVDTEHLSRVIEACQLIQQRWEAAKAPNALELLQFPGVANSESPSAESLQTEAMALFDAAMTQLLAHRAREGAQLAELIRERLEAVRSEVSKARLDYPSLLQAQRERLLERLTLAAARVEPERLEQELVYVAQKSDIAEELDRMDAHVIEVLNTLDAGGACGRRLDFLMQEFNREANTLSSKSLGMGTTLNAVELKVLIEQMREQIQNIE